LVKKRKKQEKETEVDLLEAIAAQKALSGAGNPETVTSEDNPGEKKADSESDTYKKQEATAWLDFLSEFLNLVSSVISAFFANTLVCWADCATSFESTTHCLLVGIVSGKMKNEKGHSYNYGLDRLEIIVSFVCDALAILSMIIVFISSIVGIFNPEEPEDSLIWFLVLKAINISIDLYFLYNHYMLFKKHRSMLNESELIKSRYNLTVDLAVGAVVCICYIFRTQIWVQYLSPIAGIAMVLVFTVNYITHIKTSIMELSDFSLPVEKQDEIYDIVISHRSGIQKIVSIKCHQLNKRVYIDITLILKETTTYGEQKQLLTELKKEINELIPGASVSLVLTA